MNKSNRFKNSTTKNENYAKKIDFFYCCNCGIAQCRIFSQTNSWGGPIALLILELLILIPLAKRLGIQEISQLVDKLLNRMRP